jgi:hypothetical protein
MSDTIPHRHARPRHMSVARPRPATPAPEPSRVPLNRPAARSGSTGLSCSCSTRHRDADSRQPARRLPPRPGRDPPRRHDRAGATNSTGHSFSCRFAAIWRVTFRSGARTVEPGAKANSALAIRGGTLYRKASPSGSTPSAADGGPLSSRARRGRPRVRGTCLSRPTGVASTGSRAGS